MSLVMALERVCKMTLNERISCFEVFINLKKYNWKKNAALVT